jgi:hypothetical protein
VGRVTAEQLEETRLRAGGALAAPERERLDDPEERVGVEGEVVGPERGPLAHGGELSRLEMRVRQRRDGGVGGGERPERQQDLSQAAEQQPARVAQDDEIGVVGDEAAGGPEMDEGARRGRLVAHVMDVRHHVVPQAALVVPHGIEVGVVEMAAQIGQGRVGNGDPEVSLGFRQGEPEPPPEAGAVPPAPQGLHGGRRVTRAER